MSFNWDAEMDKFYPDPQQEEETPVYHCAKCSGPIFEGEDYFKFDQEYCESCGLKLFKYIAER